MLNKMPCLSIVIPVYNMEKYIERCITSLQRQSYHNLEIIVINDGSMDNSLKLLYMLANDDKRIHVYSQDNKGVSCARNLALTHCTGEYVTFLDADDELDEHYVEDMLQPFFNENIGSMITYCDYKSILGDSCIYIPSILFHNNWGCWGKVYPLKLIKNVRFDLGLKLGEDLKFLTDVVCQGDDIELVHVNKALYYYYTNDDSATHSFSYDSSTIQSLQNEVDCYERLKKAGFNLYNTELIFNGIVASMKRFFRQPLKFIIKNREDYIYAKKIYKLYRQELRFRERKNKKAILMRILMICPFAYWIFKHNNFDQ